MPPPRADSRDQQKCSSATVFLYFLRFLKVIAILALLGDVAAYCLSMKGAIESSDMKDYAKGFFVLSAVGFCLVALLQIVAEFEPFWFTVRVRVMKYWVVRGFLLGWQGIQTINSSATIGSVVTDVSRDDFKLAGDIVGWTLIAIGALYILMSTLCLKKWFGLNKPDELVVRIVSDERMDRFGATIGVGGGDGDFDRRGNGANSNVLSPEAHVVISNMAIALDMTSSKAWDTFNGPAGAEEARRLRLERGGHNSSDNKRDQFESDYGYSAPTAVVTGSVNGDYTPVVADPKGNSSSGAQPYAYSSSAADNGYGEDASDNPRAKRMMQRDAELEANYYS